MEEKKKKGKSIFIIFMVYVAIYYIVHSLLFPVQVNGDSMNPTYQNNDFLIAIKSSSIDIEDVVIIDASKSILGARIIKRVVGVEGDKIKIQNGRLYRNGSPLHLRYLHMSEDMDEILIKKDSVFVIGDNVNNSYDSRVIGCVKLNQIMGKVIIDNEFIKGLGHVMNEVKETIPHI